MIRRSTLPGSSWRRCFRRFAGGPAAQGSLENFTDAHQAAQFAGEALQWATQSGVISGMGDGTLAPRATATRGQVAQMMMKFMEQAVA